MAHGDEASYTHSHVLLDDGRVTFACGTSVEEWPWLSLVKNISPRFPPVYSQISRRVDPVQTFM